MKKLPIRHVREGDVLALDLYTEDYRLLLNRGTKLSNTLLLLLRKHSIREMYIEDEVPNRKLYNPIEHQAQKEFHKKIYRLLYQFFTKKESMFTSDDLAKEFEKISQSLLNYIATKPNVLQSLHELQVYDENILEHSLNVGIISGTIGLEMGLDKEELLELIVGAMLAEIGMTQIPKHVLLKNSPLGLIEKKLIKRHPTLGFELLKERNIPLNSANCALYHHERIYGSGYPNKLSTKIPLFARIVAVADVYHAITSTRPYRKPFSRSEAVEFLYAAAGTLFDADIVKTFLTCIAIFPKESTVHLHNGLTASVVELYPDYPLRPLLRIEKDRYGANLNEPIDVDLRKHMNLTIVS